MDFGPQADWKIFTPAGQTAGQPVEVCVDPHNAFQTVGFAWRKSLSSSPLQCLPEPTLAIKENPNESQLLRSLRPGLAH